MKKADTLTNQDKEKARWKNIVNISSVDPNQEVTKRIPIWKKNKSVLWYYPSPCKKHDVPVFHVYSLINQAYILDLAPGSSLIEGFVNNGYDVYVLDWGEPRYEDKDLKLEHYILDYLQKAVQRSLRHSGASEVSMIGYCMGGTLAAIYAAIADEPIKNLMLMTTPIDMSHPPVVEKWVQAVQKGDFDFNPLIRAWGLMPAPFIKAGVRLVTVPIYFTHYLSLLQRSYNDQYVARWKQFNQWTNDHIPFPGETLCDFVDIVADNKLINGGLQIKEKNVDLKNISANLLVITTSEDRLIPEEMSKPVMDKVTSKDKQYEYLKGGHVSLAIKGKMPDVLEEWLSERS
ncbi:alpha/beta fold hydrolase [Virgibacillus siamensis]|uniref:alpha/beta fold hydrolase n=1 Tax=Virgibacillus siamensis TaxID=480071 RepID=UPI0009852168|nr:alpha/beta fold hydrolase [Virgibacillus siamensis]